VGFDVNTILLGGVISLVGMALLMYGRKSTRIPHMVVGLILIVYPYFVGNLFATIAIAVALIGALALVSRLGY
jgi:hypothetical protein